MLYADNEVRKGFRTLSYMSRYMYNIFTLLMVTLYYDYNMIAHWCCLIFIIHIIPLVVRTAKIKKRRRKFVV